MIETFQTFKPKYGYVMFLLDIPNWQQVQSVVDKEDLYVDPKGDRGYTKTPHVTVLYGFLDLVVDINSMTEFLKDMPKPIVKVKGISAFDTDPEYDVVKFDVESPDLRKANKKLEIFPHKKLYDGYNPHVTLAYVKKGLGAKYSGMEIPEGMPLTFNPTQVMYSSPTRQAKISVNLNVR